MRINDLPLFLNSSQYAEALSRHRMFANRHQQIKEKMGRQAAEAATNFRSLELVVSHLTLFGVNDRHLVILLMDALLNSIAENVKSPNGVANSSDGRAYQSGVTQLLISRMSPR